MKNKYFDKWEFQHAISFIETNPLVAKLKLKKYLKEYPKDYSAQIYYSSILITLGEFTEAEYVLDSLEYLVSIDERIENKFSEKSQKKLQSNLISSRLRLLAYQERYKELYQYYLSHLHQMKYLETNMKPFIFYCKKKLGMLDRNRREQHTYIFRQIIHYEEADFLEHIKKHLNDYNNNAEETNSSVFSPNFPLEEVLNEIKKYIPSSKKIYPYLYADVYIFKYNECGKDKNIPVDYIKVICFHNTSDIITMCPISGYENFEYTDLSYLIKHDNNPKKRTLSQIDKFNQRYGHKN